jgi:hypothetical protein
MPVKLREADIVEAVTLFKKYRARYGVMESTRKVEADMGLPAHTVYELIRRLRSTTDVATQYIQSNALKLAMRVVRKANVDQAIGVLSRPNIGVLDPAGEGGGGGGRQFMVGVAMDSLGSVKVGVQIGPIAGAIGSGEARSASPRDNTEGVEDGMEMEGALQTIEEEATESEVGIREDEPKPRRNWLYKDPPKPRLEPIPLAENRSARGPGGSLDYRLAQAKAERKEQARAKEKKRREVNQRAKELAELLKKAREVDR